LAGAPLDTANDFVLVALLELKVIIGQVSPFLFQLALGNVPVAFHFGFIHVILLGSIF
jgi:hypothetical protein